MYVQFYILTGLMLGFEYVAVEDTLIIDVFILRIMFQFDGDDE